MLAEAFHRKVVHRGNENERGFLMIAIGDLHLAQEDGGPPTTLAAGSAPGESGVSVLSVRFERGLHLAATLRQHLVCFQMSHLHIDCRMADRVLQHEPPPGALAICPAGIDCAADADAEQGVVVVLVAVDPGRFALAAAEDSAIEAQLTERLSGFDPTLLDLARRMVSESAVDYPNGAFFWNELASRFIDRLVACHALGLETRARGRIGKETLSRLKDYVIAHIDEPVDVATLASLANRSPFQFSRVFTRSVGLSLHRYIVHLRLLHAIELVRSGRASLAEIAASTGFADQSHLSRWIRRVHGVSPTQLIG
jgi:AraC family transcriptional regulator